MRKRDAERLAAFINKAYAPEVTAHVDSDGRHPYVLVIASGRGVAHTGWFDANTKIGWREAWDKLMHGTAAAVGQYYDCSGYNSPAFAIAREIDKRGPHPPDPEADALLRAEAIAIVREELGEVVM